MPDWSVLKNLIMPDLIGSLAVENGMHCAILKEHAADAKLKRVDIVGVSNDSLLIDLDKYDQPRSLFCGDHGERCRCDYVLATEFGGYPLLLFIEIKSGKASDAEVLRQFRGGECTLDYCESALARFHGIQSYLHNCRRAYVVFYKPRLAKTTTRPTSPAKPNTRPDQAFKCASPHKPHLNTLVRL